MSFQTPRSIEEMLTAIHKREYLMPAIQREFVWGADQITKLVDSLMRGGTRSARSCSGTSSLRPLSPTRSTSS
ncbi:hypothetical protein HMPREF1531_00115 [Propionibacterium sp. oral taxon 192 str. F0372]|uniref:DUF262 domain-containing protein n=1 Tax=Propionibacterium sp. oral taxon 192 TaxID=671222 RepID=UPI0003533BB9|nr:DUF262 domain-containing protein [Propionibacterium sp. oral taxon 192]EPH07066.1 hypothetical protein HMPREF1531_00115 [Propionibacterium sp. oral taxon 192 str. F0372]